MSRNGAREGVFSWWGCGFADVRDRRRSRMPKVREFKVEELMLGVMEWREMICEW